MIETRGWVSKRQTRCPRRRGRCVRNYGGLGPWPQQMPVEIVALTLSSISRLYESTEAALSLIRLPVPVW